jgi:predicted dehydrogenase
MRIGILGFGSIGQRHGRNLLDMGHEVQFHDSNAMLGSVARMPLIQSSDAVIICTPSINHAEDLIDVLGNRKHALVEKPIGYDCPPFIAGVIMGARSKARDLIVATGFMCRFHPTVQQAKKLLDDGYFGKPNLLQLQVLQKNNKPDYLRDGVIRNWASHEIDIARYILGDMFVAGCNAKTLNGQDIAARIFMESIEHDCSVEVEADYTTHPEIRGFRIKGSKESGGFILNNDIIPSANQKIWDQTYRDEMQAFLGAIDGKDPGPLASGTDGVAALQIVMEAREKAGLENATKNI